MFIKKINYIPQVNERDCGALNNGHGVALIFSELKDITENV